jgi:hypothetical protein
MCCCVCKCVLCCAVGETVELASLLSVRLLLLISRGFVACASVDISCLLTCVPAGVSVAEVASVLSGSRDLEEVSLGSTGLSGSLSCELALPNLKVCVCVLQFVWRGAGGRGGAQGGQSEGGGGGQCGRCHWAAQDSAAACPVKWHCLP